MEFFPDLILSTKKHEMPYLEFSSVFKNIHIQSKVVPADSVSAVGESIFEGPN